MRTERFALQKGRGYIKSQLGNPIMFGTKKQAEQWARFTNVDLNKVVIVKVTVTIQPTEGLKR